VWLENTIEWRGTVSLIFTVTSPDTFVKQESGSVKTTSIEPRQRPMWARGSARLDGNDIVLRREDAEDYAFFEEDRLDKLVLDVAGLRNIGTLTDSEQLDPQPALAFVKRHGLLWHGPEQLASGECREPLRSLYFEGEELTLSIALYMLLYEKQRIRVRLSLFSSTYGDCVMWGSSGEPCHKTQRSC
jgi:hypothetical protein